MGSESYISASGASAQLRDLDVVANNLSNVGTPGYKRSQSIFRAVLESSLREEAGQLVLGAPSTAFVATDEIGAHVARIQASTGDAVSAIGRIGGRVQELSAVATRIASAVEQQGAATQEIVRNVSQAAQGAADVTGTIAGVADAAKGTGAAADQVLTAASELSLRSGHLRDEVTRFLATVRAA